MHFYRNRADMPSIQVERIQNVAGSTAGAGSADYYLYRNRRRDALAQESIQQRDEILSEEQKKFEGKIIAERTNLALKQKKRKEKRLKKKQGKATAKLAKRMNRFKNDGSFLAQVEGETNLGKRDEKDADSDDEGSEESESEQDPQHVATNPIQPLQTEKKGDNQNSRRAAEQEESIEPKAEKRQKTD